MSGDAGAGGPAEVDTEVEAVGAVDALHGTFGELGQIDQFMSGFSRQLGEAVEVGVGHDHDVARGVGEGVEADEAVFSAMDEAAGGFGLIRTHAIRDGEVDAGDEVAKDAAEVARPGGEARGNAGARCGFRRGDVGIAPGCPEMVHDCCAVQTV